MQTGDDRESKPGVIWVILAMVMVSIVMFASVVIVVKNKESIKKYIIVEEP